MKHLFFFVFLLLPSLFFAQTFSVKGTIQDSTNAPVIAATVVLMEAKDSALLAFVQSDEKGAFELREAKGNYILQVSSIGYKAHYQMITLDENVVIDNILLQTESKILKEFSVTAEAIPIKMDNDTIEYNAKVFKPQAGSMVEDLLKKLPGVEVDASGAIKAHGKDIKKILVDGEEFFGNDPKVATKNLPADIVDKIQVFDKRSEQAEFSGVDDGNDEKTINIKLRSDKKHGYFGNAEAGVGTGSRYNSRASINRFSKTTQLSFIGLANNVNAEGFSVEDYMRFMGGMGRGDGGQMRISLDGNSPIPVGQSRQNGIVDTKAGGLNFNRRWNKTTRLSANYFISALGQKNEQLTNRQNFVRDGYFTNRDTQNIDNQSLNHRLNMTFRHQIDSMQNIRLQFNGNLSTADAMQNVFKNLSNESSVTTSRSLQNYISTAEQYNWRSDALYRRKIGRKGSTMALGGNYGRGNNALQGFLFANNDFYSPFLKRDTLLQRQSNEDASENYRIHGNYTHSLGKGRFLQLGTSLQNTDNQNIKQFFDLKNRLDEDGTENTTLSNGFNRGYVYRRGGLTFQRNTKVEKFSAGVSLQQSQQKGTLRSESKPYKNTFLNILPNLRYRKEMARAKNFELNYTTSVQEPSAQDLQPIIDNADPLNLRIGNPNLKVAYTHDLGVNYMRFNQFEMRSFFTDFTTTFTTNKVAYERSVDSAFRQIIRPINVRNDFQARTYTNFSTPMRFMKAKLNLNVNLNYNRALQPVNSQTLVANTYRSNFDVMIENRKKDHLDLQVGSGLDFNTTHFEVQSLRNQQFVNQNYFIDALYKFGTRFTLQSAFRYNIYTAANIGEQQIVPLWTANATYYFLKNNKMKLKIAAFDLLNRNAGISRNATANYIQEVRNSALGRYFLVTVGYNLSGFGSKENGGGERGRVGK